MGSTRSTPGTAPRGPSSGKPSRTCRLNSSQRNRSPTILRASKCHQPLDKTSPSSIRIPAAPGKTGPLKTFEPSPLNLRASNGANRAVSPIYTNSPAGSQPQSCISGTIPASAIWPPPSGLPSSRSSSPPIPASGLPAEISSPSSRIRRLTRFSAPVRSTRS